MSHLRDMSIKLKLILIIVAASMSACIIALGSIGFYDIQSMRKNMLNRLELDALLTGQNCTAVLDFGSPGEADDILANLHTVPHIQNAYLLNDSTKLFGQYHRDKIYQPLLKMDDLTSHRFGKGYVILGRPIKKMDTTLGYLVIRASTDEVAARIRMYLGTAAFILVLVFLLSLFMGAKLQKSISEPILQLAHIAKKISAEKDYMIRVKKYASDEIGILYEEFNSLIKKIHDREIDRNTAEIALRESEEKYRSLYTSITDPIFIFNIDTGLLLDCNEAAVRRYGYSHQEIKKMRLADLHPPEEQAAVEDQIRQKIIFEKTRHMHITKSGEKFNIEIHSSRLTYQGRNACISIIRDISDQIHTRTRIERDLQEKEILLKEIHHRVKNNLQVISSLLSLQSRHVKDKESLSMFRESQNRVRSMALVHEQLYATNNFALVDLGKYIENLSRGLFRAYRTNPEMIDFTIDIKNVALGIDRAIPCGLIINELISNALKHAFSSETAQHKMLRVAMKKQNSHIELIVQDNGAGLPADFSIEESDSLGMKLVTLLARDQLNGRIQIESDGGTKFIISFKDE